MALSLQSADDNLLILNGLEVSLLQALGARLNRSEAITGPEILDMLFELEQQGGLKRLPGLTDESLPQTMRVMRLQAEMRAVFTEAGEKTVLEMAKGDLEKDVPAAIRALDGADRNAVLHVLNEALRTWEAEYSNGVV
ncbi:hypothetical protein GC177_08055 [bacterium]|nr:hypothetical protein [bacterium]